MEKVSQTHASSEPHFYAELGPIYGNIIWETHTVVLALTKFCLYLNLFDSYYPCDTNIFYLHVKSKETKLEVRGLGLNCRSLKSKSGSPSVAKSQTELSY